MAKVKVRAIRNWSGDTFGWSITYKYREYGFSRTWETAMANANRLAGILGRHKQ